MRDSQPKTIFLKDYQVPEFLIDHSDLHFTLAAEETTVRSRLSMRRNAESTVQDASLVLHGQDMRLQSVSVDGLALAPEAYKVDEETLTLFTVPDKFTLECVTEIKPQQNTSLEGLYRSSKMYCTQCEAEGFRKITYYLDRPDVMSLFTTTIVADKTSYPVLLSNGNNVASGENSDGSHWVTWEDPFKKPAYLFALVAGDLAFIEDSFTTCSGKDVTLRIFVEAKDLDKCDHAMQSLKRSMLWDEETFGREYDLSIFNIVAVDDFNMGAMENKSLNIFNTSCVLAKPETTTDATFQRVEAIVAHEYFHNWSGNRVTCRDWFQLSLKEGFTVYRDAEFSSEMGSRTVKRVEDVNFLRTVQFAEDGGPMAHPIRPESFMEISNFYTVTVYEKGAEIVRMIAHLLGDALFRKGSDLYFDRHDGQAVTCEDFVKAMEDASGKDLSQFRCWYSQAGTPQLHVTGEYSAEHSRYTLTVKQYYKAAQQHNQPVHIPLAMALLGEAGALRLQLQGAAPNPDTADNTELVLDVTEAEQQFVFENIPEQPVPSLLRGFSAPVQLQFAYSRDELMFLVSNDSDGFCRWDACQQLGVLALKDMIAAHQAGEDMQLDHRLITAYEHLLTDESLDKSMVALMLSLPSEAYMASIMEKADVQAIHVARMTARVEIAEQLQELLWDSYNANVLTVAYQADEQQIAARSLKNTALHYLMLLENEQVLNLCLTQYQQAQNMTDSMAALAALVNSSFEQQKQNALADFYQRWQAEALVVNQWLSVQAGCYLAGTLDRVQALMAHQAFDIKNPNKVRSVIGAFTANAVNFHQTDGSGYQFLADQIIILNTLNPQIAARLLGPLTKWKQYKNDSAALMRDALQRIMGEEKLSKDVYEVVSKSLQA
ncbi:aminopeptidase N [Dasania marina]|uniref:aminopeptidase N n=1 Tax=Dasania marina TaxID=471499 RepID=UPI000477CBAC|nr:aminopeptidase N [Dasania marina]